MNATVTFPITAVAAVDLDQQTFSQILRPMLRSAVGGDVFDSWFARLQLDAIAGDTARLSVPTNFLRSWLQQHFAEKLTPLFAQVFPAVTKIVIGVRTGARPIPRAPLSLVSSRTPDRPEAVAPARELPPAARALSDFEGSRVDARYTLQNFHPGASNRAALSAVESLASAGDPICNPVFVHGSVGVGKTHLLQAAANAAKAAGLRVLYLTAERFMYGFAVSVKAHSLVEFKRRIRDFDLLIIDDAQFLLGKAAQVEFGRTVDAIMESRGRLLVAADQPPNGIEEMDPRIRSRLSGGLAVLINAPNLDLRIRLLEVGIAEARKVIPHLDLAPGVIEHVATLIQTNGRDLEGAVNRLKAAAAMAGMARSQLSIQAAEAAVRDLVRAVEPRKVKIEEIQKLVASHYSVSRGDIMSSRRTHNVVLPRQVAMYLSKVMTLRSLPEIGRRFGGRDHTTVLHAVRKIEGLIVSKDNGGLAEDVRVIRALLEAH